MIYVMSDIHGDYEKYQSMLGKLPMTKKDALIILGDVFDRGKNGIKILFDIMQHENFFMIMGNHEQIALACLKTLSQEITEKSIASLKEDTTEMLVEWLYNLGGETTSAEFAKLSKEDKEEVIDFLDTLPLYEKFTINGQEYLLVHGGLENFHPDKSINDYTEDELVWSRIDYGMKYFDNKIVVTGHTPTRNIEENPRPDFIYKANNHIAIDCGCGFNGGQLGCICLNTMEEFYV